MPVAAQGEQRFTTLPEHEVVSRLQSRDFDQMSEALNTIRILDTDSGFSPWRLADGVEVGVPVRTALIESLDYHLEQYGAMSDGLPYNASYMNAVPDGWGSVHCIHVIALQDEAAIPVLLIATGYGWGPVYALLDFGSIAVTPALECAENDTIWTGAVRGCMDVLTVAAYLWQDQLSSTQLARMQAVARQRLSRPLADYSRASTGVYFAYAAAELALALGWTGELRDLARSRLKEMDHVQYYWQYDAILKYLSGNIASTSMANLIRSARH